MEEQKALSDFYAVTQTSIYHVIDKKNKNREPVVKKIALRGESKIPKGNILKGGRLVGITRFGIILYDEDFSPFSQRPHKKHQDPELVNTIMWGGKTSPLVALFLDRKQALTCLNFKSLSVCDPRWQKETKEVLDAIGDNHPVFVISQESHPLVSKYERRPL